MKLCKEQTGVTDPYRISSLVVLSLCFRWTTACTTMWKFCVSQHWTCSYRQSSSS